MFANIYRAYEKGLFHIACSDPKGTQENLKREEILSIIEESKITYLKINFYNVSEKMDLKTRGWTVSHSNIEETFKFLPSEKIKELMKLTLNRFFQDKEGWYLSLEMED
jgi:hypothetical protein